MPPDQLPVDNSPEFESLLLQNDENAQVNQELLETIVEQNENNTQILNSSIQKGSSDIVQSVEQLKPELQKSSDATSKMVEFLSEMKGEKGDPGKDGYTPEKGKDYYTKEEIAEVVKEIQDSIRIPEDGLDAYTPVRGEDYFTDEDITAMVSDVFSRIPTPKDGKDAAVDYEMIISECIARIPKPKNGKNGKSGLEITSEQILDKIRGLLSYNDLKDLPTIFKNSGISARDYDLVELKDVSITSPSNGQVLKYNSTTRKWTNDTDTGGAPGGADTQVQFNDAGAFGGDAGFTYNKTTNKLSLGGDIGLSTGVDHNILIEDQTTVDTSGNTLYIKGAAGNGTGDGGLVDITSGAGGTAGRGGAVNILAGAGGSDAGAAQPGGTVYVSGGDATGGTSNGGDIVFSPGQAHGGGTVGHVKINQDTASSVGAIFDASLISATDKTFTFPNTSGTLALTSNLTGYVTGPASSTDNAIARFDGLTGKIIQDYTSGAPTISDTGDITLGKEAAHSITLGASTTLAASGGALTIASGDASSTTGSGGALVLNSGRGGGTTGTAGAITIQPGTQTTGSPPALNLLGRSAASSGTGGAVVITAGNASSSSAGGALTATGGAGSSTSNGTSGAGGLVTVTGNTGGSSSNASGTGGAGGGLTLSTGTGGTASGATSSTGGKGGSISILAKNGGTVTGTTTAIGGAGGDIAVTAGNGATATTGSANTAGVGGSVTITAGNAGAAGGNVNGGNIILQTGSKINNGVTGYIAMNIGGATEKVRLTPTGFGIGISAPVALAHIYEDTSTTGTGTGLTIENDGTGDAKIDFLLTGAQRWIMGADNSNSDGFALSSATDLGTSDRLFVTTGGLVGLGTSAPTHTLTLPSTSTGIALYNTADQVTNFELGQLYWSSNVLKLQVSKGGSGGNRNIELRTSSRTFTFLDAGSASDNSGFMQIASSTSGQSNQLGLGGTYSNSSSVAGVLSIGPTMNQSGTAGYNALKINVTESATGSGVKRLISAQVGGVDKFVVNNTGVATVAAVGTAAGSVVSVDGTQTLTSKTLTAPVINASTQTGNQNIAAVPASDHTANGPTTSIFNLGATIALMDLVYLGSSSKWLLTDADAAATGGGMLGICLDGGGDTDTTTVALFGAFVRDDTWNWTPGATLYIDTATPGAITATAPSGTDDVVRVVGFAVTADVIYFAPSSDYITIV
jgi:hypothetical protein